MSGMSTDSSEPIQALKQPLQPVASVVSNNPVSQEAVNLASTVETIHQLANKVPTPNSDPQQAKVDETTILDNNGGRIELNEDLLGPNVIKK